MAFYLNSARDLIGYRLIGTGNKHTCVVDTRLIVSLALHSMATYVIFAHNNPCSELEATQEDKDMAHKLYKALFNIDVVLLDHFIISDFGYFSMKYRVVF